MSLKHISRPLISPPIALLFAVLAVSTASIFIRFAQESTPSLVIAAYRLSLATLILAPVALWRNSAEIRAIARKKQIALAVISGIFLALHFATWITSLAYTTVASSVVLVATTPLWVALFSPLFLHESLNRIIVIGLFIALLGSVVVGLSDACRFTPSGMSCVDLAQFSSGEGFWGDMLALLGAIFAAGYLMIGRNLRPAMSILSYTFLVYGAGAIALLVFMGLTGLRLTGYPPINYVWFVALALIPQLIGHSTYNWSLRYLPAAFVSVFLLGEPIGSTVLAYFILNEIPNALKIAGGVMILAGILVASRSR
ncbi:MAG: DMT family transporter [Chloroflexi bacterium]|nr:DMT family transporter [Chloroflexota bacterium]